MKRNFKAITLTGLLVFWCLAPGRALGQDPKLKMDDYDRLAATATDVVLVSVDESMLQLAARFLSSKRSSEEAKIKDLINGLKGVYVKRFEFEKEGGYSESDVDQIRSRLDAGGWVRIVDVHSKRKGHFEVRVLSEGDIIRGLAVVAAEPNAFTLVNIVGPIDLEKLRELEGEFGIPRLGIEPADQSEGGDPQVPEGSKKSDGRTRKSPPVMIRNDKP